MKKRIRIKELKKEINILMKDKEFNNINECLIFLKDDIKEGYFYKFKENDINKFLIKNNISLLFNTYSFNLFMNDKKVLSTLKYLHDAYINNILFNTLQDDLKDEDFKSILMNEETFNIFIKEHYNLLNDMNLIY